MSTDTTHEFAGRGNVCERLFGAPSGRGIERDRCGQPRSAAIHSVSTPTEPQYVTSKEECERSIKGVCEGCGGTLTAIETVDNSGRPTFWQGCEHCSCFRGGVERKYFEVARKLVEDRVIVPYGHMCRVEYENTPERLEYYFDSQTAGLSHTIKQIHKLLEPASDTPPTTEATAAPERVWIDPSAPNRMYFVECYEPLAEHLVQYISAAAHEKELAGMQHHARNMEETVDNVRDAMGLESTHWQVIADDVRLMREEHDQFATEVSRLREALREIAAYDDEPANARLEATGSYVLFDEPGSVKIARAALNSEGKEQG